MQRDYRDLIEEIQEITTVDGFVSSCLEIKESMFFYERDLMLAAYSASLELLGVATLLSALIQGKRELVKAEAELERCVESLLAELEKYQFPLDIQYVVDRFLQGVGLQIRWRIPVYLKMIRAYGSTNDFLDDDLDTTLRKAHFVLRKRNSDVEEELSTILGLAGAKMLRGAELRPIWLQVSHPRIQAVLLGLQTLVNNLKVTPYFNYPLEDLTTERQKRKKIKGNVVSDLGVFRNFRQGGSGYTDLNIALAKDEYDQFIEGFFSGFEYLDIEPDQTVVELITTIFEARLVNDEIDQRFLMRIIVYCNRWQLSEVSDVVLEILGELDMEDPLFYEFWSLLKSFDAKALPAMRRYARMHRDSPLLPYLALFLSHGPPTKRRWSLLKEIFEHYPEENEEKGHMAISIARYGGAEAVHYLEEVLASSKHANGAYRKRLEKALAAARQSVQ
ncbi:MAG: hypothetical protein GX971_12425 [Firmicutes bacterium]|nr:hypothetical protein [Bacillota bacterium]